VVRAALIGVCAVTAIVGTACSDLLDTNTADAVIQIEADDQPAVLTTRQEVLASAPEWGGKRVAEQTMTPDETALEFMLPGEKLEIALGALDRLEARIVSTTIEVDSAQIERATTTTADGTPAAADPEDGQVRLRVEIEQARPAGAGALLRVVMALFSIVGMVATVMWILNWWRRRGEDLPPRRRIDRVDLRGDPPTQETPRVPPQW